MLWLENLLINLDEDFQKRHYASLLLKGLQKCQASNLKSLGCVVSSQITSIIIVLIF